MELVSTSSSLFDGRFFLPAFWLATSSGHLFPPDIGREPAGAQEIVTTSLSALSGCSQRKVAEHLVLGWRPVSFPLRLQSRFAFVQDIFSRTNC